MVTIENTETGQIDTLPNPQAISVIQRTNGLWRVYEPPTTKPVLTLKRSRNKLVR